MADSPSVTSDIAQSSPPSEVLSPQSKPAKSDFWFAVFECIEGAPKVNFDKLAEKCHYKNAATARVIYNQRRKVVLSGDAAASPSVATGQTGAKRGRKPKDSTNGGEPPKRRGRKPKDAAADGPPKKRGRPAKKVDPPPPSSSSPPPPPSSLKPESENEEEKETEVDDSEYE